MAQPRLAHSSTESGSLARVAANGTTFKGTVASRWSGRSAIMHSSTYVPSLPRRLSRGSDIAAHWTFASGCSPPRLAATQLPSATRDQTSLREGLAPRRCDNIAGALGDALRGVPNEPDDVGRCIQCAGILCNWMRPQTPSGSAGTPRRALPTGLWASFRSPLHRRGRDTRYRGIPFASAGRQGPWPGPLRRAPDALCRRRRPVGRGSPQSRCGPRGSKSR